MATGAAVGTSTRKASTVISGRLRQTELTLGTVDWLVVSLESIGTVTTSEAVFQFVAFGIKNVGLWGA